jgi:hypothetical protein
MCQWTLSPATIPKIYPIYNIRIGVGFICHHCQKKPENGVLYGRPIMGADNNSYCRKCFRFYEGEP